MPSHPEIQAKAHEELDRVIGQEQWPIPEDEKRACRTSALSLRR